MKAVVYEQYGSPEVFQIKEIEKPVPKDNEVLIKVFATTINRTDCGILRAKPFIVRFFTGLRRPNKIIPGTDFAGKIEAIGAKVTSFKPGNDVFGFYDIGLCSQAQYMTYPENKGMEKIPQNMSYEQAVACLEGAHYAYNFINKVNLKSGDKVLVNGATGAIGSALVQLSKYFGAEITAVCNGKDEELVRSIGAQEVIDYSTEDFTKTKRKFKYVFDGVGKSTYGRCKPILESGGAYLSAEPGQNWQNLFYIMYTQIFGDKKVIFPFPANIKRSIQLIKDLCEEGLFKAVIDREYPMEKIVDAYTYVESGEKIGNVILNMQ